MCSAVLRAERAREIGVALETAHARGNGILFTTLTLRHKQADELIFSLDVLMQAWRKVTSWTAWKKLSKRIGLVGFIRSTEVTLGGNGWHPHGHFAMVTQEPLSDDLRAAFEAELSAIWVRAVEAVGGRLPSRDRGVVVLAADSDPDGISDYVSKAQERVGQERRSIALELARGDLKKGRAGSCTPFELLDDETGSARVRELWLEYVTATKGRRAFGWSRGLRAELIPEEEELTDEEVLERAETGELLGYIEGRVWDLVYRDSPRRMHEALSEAEAIADAAASLISEDS